MKDKRVQVIQIPQIPQGKAKPLAACHKKRVCAYCRVSTEEETQAASFQLQISHYTDLIRTKEDWEFTGIYCDYGKSATSTRRRDEFRRMIDDCKGGKIDLIITKSISRFARNTLDCLGYIRELKSLSPPVGVYFQRERLDTLDPKNEFLLTILSSLAQEEARNISENMKWGIQKRFQAGKARCPTRFLLGYEKDEEGNLVIQEEEAEIVRRVYREYLAGKGAKRIAGELKAEGVPSGRGGSGWGKSSVLHMLKNEKYCGDVLMQKYYTEDYLTRKKKENKGRLPQYYIKDHHPAVIPRDEWKRVQVEMKRRGEMKAQAPGMRQGYSSVSPMSNRLFCGCCGQPLTRTTVVLSAGGNRERVSVFRCRAASPKVSKRLGINPCKSRRFQEQRLGEAFAELIGEWKEAGSRDGSGKRNPALWRRLKDVDPQQGFDASFFREWVEKAFVFDDGRIQFYLKGGLALNGRIPIVRSPGKQGGFFHVGAFGEEER